MKRLQRSGVSRRPPAGCDSCEPASSENESGNPETVVLRGATGAQVSPFAFRWAWSGLVGRAWAQHLPPCSPVLSVASAAQGAAGKTAVWLWLVRDTRVGRVPVKVKDTYFNSGLELLNHSILKSKYFVWHFDS